MTEQKLSILKASAQSLLSGLWPQSAASAGNVVLGITDVFASIDATGGARTATLPLLSAAYTALGQGALYAVRKSDSSLNAVTVTCAGSDTINGQATYALTSQYDAVLFIAGSAAWSVIGIGGGAGALLRSAWIPAMSMIPLPSNAPTAKVTELLTTNNVVLSTYAFPDSGTKFLQVPFTLPSNWNLGALRLRYYWTQFSPGSTGGTVRFAASGKWYADGDAVNSAFGSTVNTDDTQASLDTILISPQSANVTLAGTPAASQMGILEITRDNSVGGNADGDADLVGIELAWNPA